MALFTPVMFLKTDSNIIDIVGEEIRIYHDNKSETLSFDALFPEFPISDIETLKAFCEHDNADPANLIINSYKREY